MRKPRRIRLAAPIVVTLAAAGCGASNETPNNPPPPNLNPPPHELVAPTATPSTAPVADPKPVASVASDLPEPSGKGNVVRNPDGTCTQYPDMSGCPPKAACNPPPPHQVRCPAK